MCDVCDGGYFTCEDGDYREDGLFEPDEEECFDAES